MSLWSVHYDKKHWGDPEVFRPERHLNDKGEIISDEWLLPFGLGEWITLLVVRIPKYYKL
jgi:methyl farnesoate epoxidase/farnesoate epoxidase